MAARLGRNDPCWCGSGRKYKKCHLDRDKQKRLPLAAVEALLRRGRAYKTCLHPEASRETCGKIISAHTLQRARVLEAIADEENHVLTFFPPHMDSDGSLTVQRRGWRQASTFTAFCDRHDTTAFAPLEQAPFEGSKEQIFLVGYRAVCWELFQKTRAIKAGPILRGVADRGAPLETQRHVQGMISVQEAGYEKGLDDLAVVKRGMDQAFLTGDHRSYRTLELRFEGSLTVAATGAVTPNRSLGGAALQTLHDPQSESQWLAFGVDVRERIVSVAFIWPEGDTAPEGFMQDLAAIPDNRLPSFLTQFFFAYCENTYFSPAWWHSLVPDDRALLARHMANSNPYYFPPSYDLDRPLVDWRSLDRRSA